ncbi:four helix bundle protein [Rubinisphaera sp.]|uniref:four helix bundle protein n=1 Tax=Rubinisphaera sp. TaxID=2024857 RepID=UPI000C11EAF6|nr:four helix bundle protein [Rubinisphaera sp.]MBV09323.1 four helix bundle protein [Rubinisphaera sp.]HCS52110.1 four helix bundle protein [Planctomycetaceae bacterium]|tara:strand:- start:398 stop:769 length:372 start_codon:yes stop_codon:yes gene_type:complete
MPQFRFEKLDVWQKAIDLAESVYRISANFPQREIYGLTSQIRRAIVSVSSNIAEGNGRSTNKEYVRFIEIAYASLMEVVSQLTIAQKLNFITHDQLDELKNQANDIARMLSGLRSYLQDKKST